MTNEIILKMTKGVNQPLTYVIDGDHTERNVYFTIKKSLISTDDRLLDKIITEKTFSDGKTTLNFILLPSETQDLPNFVYCGITSVSMSDIDDIEEPLNGYINLLPNVRTPSDGLPEDVPASAIIEASNATVGDFITCKLVGGKKVFVNVTETELKTILGLPSPTPYKLVSGNAMFSDSNSIILNMGVYVDQLNTGISDLVRTGIGTFNYTCPTGMFIPNNFHFFYSIYYGHMSNVKTILFNKTWTEIEGQMTSRFEIMLCDVNGNPVIPGGNIWFYWELKVYD